VLKRANAGDNRTMGRESREGRLVNRRYGSAIVLAVVAVAAAVVLGSLRLNPHGAGSMNMGGLNGVNAGQVAWTAERASWQTPVAIVIAVLGLGAAVGVAAARSTRAA
jgi:hypothetical protein